MVTLYVKVRHNIIEQIRPRTTLYFLCNILSILIVKLKYWLFITTTQKFTQKCYIMSQLHFSEGYKFIMELSGTMKEYFNTFGFDEMRHSQLGEQKSGSNIYGINVIKLFRKIRVWQIGSTCLAWIIDLKLKKKICWNQNARMHCDFNDFSIRIF